jgi:lysophospholipase L1-like esterase
MTPEEAFEKIESAFDEIAQEQLLVDELKLEVDKIAKDWISRHYPDDINHLSAEGYRMLNFEIGDHATELAFAIMNTIYKYKEK